MLPQNISLDVVTPDRRALSAEAAAVVLPGERGAFGVRPGHHPMLAALRPGLMKVRRAGGVEERFAVGAGFAEVLPARVNVLVSSCERAEEIDLERARAALSRAEQRLRERRAGVDRQRAERALERARARLRVAERRPAG
ncbi:MAG: F0F1 ATP synthase subunit epsilon [Candidatus Rokubacteria bacterium]|nr:F0F1 ATP synthase subunit epsilon [Candidatus Rokubacteria bacterium]